MSLQTIEEEQSGKKVMMESPEESTNCIYRIIDAFNKKFKKTPENLIQIKPLKKKYLEVLREILAENFRKYHEIKEFADHGNTVYDFLSRGFLSREIEKSDIVNFAVVGKKVMAGGGLIIPEKRIFHAYRTSPNGERCIIELLKNLEVKAREKGVDVLEIYPWVFENYDPFMSIGYNRETITDQPDAPTRDGYLSVMKMSKVI